MKKLKRLLSCLLTGTMLFSLAACNQQDPQQSQTAEPSQTIQKAPDSKDNENGSGNTLVIYFSATGSTEAVAQYIVDTLGGDSYEIIPEEPYTSDDLDWTNSSSRVSMEHEDSDFRPAIAGEIPNMSSYDTIYLGYPIWWGEAPNIVRTFMESVDLSGKTIIPFCTSSSSGFGSSGETLQAFAPDAIWLDGERFSSSVDEAEVIQWVNGLKINE